MIKLNSFIHTDPENKLPQTASLHCPKRLIPIVPAINLSPALRQRTTLPDIDTDPTSKARAQAYSPFCFHTPETCRYLRRRLYSYHTEHLWNRRRSDQRCRPALHCCSRYSSYKIRTCHCCTQDPRSSLNFEYRQRRVPWKSCRPTRWYRTSRYTAPRSYLRYTPLSLRTG